MSQPIIVLDKDLCDWIDQQDDLCPVDMTNNIIYKYSLTTCVMVQYGLEKGFPSFAWCSYGGWHEKEHQSIDDYIALLQDKKGNCVFICDIIDWEDWPNINTFRDLKNHVQKYRDRHKINHDDAVFFDSY